MLYVFNVVQCVHIYINIYTHIHDIDKAVLEKMLSKNIKYC